MTVRQLAARSGLGLTIVAGGAGADRVITWAHGIELPDPTPWLSGGELVMTTGLALPDEPDGLARYVYRLAQAGVAALAIDTGITLSDVPAPVVEAADSLGFAVLRVPPRTPFIAISRAVIDDLNADQLRIVREVVDNQERLARAAARGGLSALVDTLASRLDASVCVVDRTGTSLAAAGASTDLPSLVEARRSAENGRITGSRVLADEHRIVSITPLQPSGEPQGYLAVATAQSPDNAARLLVGHAVSLLSLELSKPTGILDAEQRLRSAATALLRSGGELDERLAAQLGFASGDEVTTLFVTEHDDIGGVVTVLDGAGGPYLLETLDDGVLITVRTSSASAVVQRLSDELSLTTSVRIGIGRSGSLNDVRSGVRQARAAAFAHGGPDAVVHVDDVGSLSLLLGLGDDTITELITASGLRILLDYDEQHRTELTATLASYLRHTGQWDASAAALSIHRHTMRNRIHRIAELIGRDVDAADVRAELWLALQARETTAE